MSNPALKLVEKDNMDKNKALDAALGQIERAFAEAADAVGRPAPLMARAQKVRVVHDLERRGIFLIKGAVDEVARLLGVSRYTVYNYRKEVSAV